MPKYIVYLLEVHKIGMTVEADDPLAAIDRAMSGNGEFRNSTYEESFLEPAELQGISVDELLEKFPELTRKDVLAVANITEDYIPAIYAVENEDV
jgi:hypothetical protein